MTEVCGGFPLFVNELRVSFAVRCNPTGLNFWNTSIIKQGFASNACNTFTLICLIGSKDISPTSSSLPTRQNPGPASRRDKLRKSHAVAADGKLRKCDVRNAIAGPSAKKDKSRANTGHENLNAGHIRAACPE